MARQGKRKNFRLGKRQIRIMAPVIFLLLFLLWINRNLFLQKDPVFQPLEETENLPENLQKEEETYFSVVEEFNNVLLLNAGKTGACFLYKGKEFEFPFEKGVYENLFPDRENVLSGKEQVGDFVVTDGKITDFTIKTERVGGKLLTVGDGYIELEGMGKLSLGENWEGYRLYGSSESCDLNDLPIGYNYTDFVLDQGKICCFLIMREEYMEYIRVLIKGSDFEGVFHKRLEISCTGDYLVERIYKDRQETKAETKDKCFVVSEDMFEGEKGLCRILVHPYSLGDELKIENIVRSAGVPSYSGNFEISLGKDGLILVNELPLEEYLYKVLPSEMPAGYPTEALKAQAVCARTYAYGKILKAAYPQYGAHVDDSTSFQVYNNSIEDNRTSQAVKDTYKILLYATDGKPAETFYYSTSCGLGTTASVWKNFEEEDCGYIKAKKQDPRGEELGKEMTEEEFRKVIDSIGEEDFEKEESWYRWTYRVESIDPGQLQKRLKQRWEAKGDLVLTKKGSEYVNKAIGDFDKITGLSVVKRGAGGILDELLIETDKNSYKVISEYNIRSVLATDQGMLSKQDGKKNKGLSLLPSAFFYIEEIKDEKEVSGYILYGGGYGHGVGLSQNGAKNMALQGWTYDRILAFYYGDCIVKGRTNE